MNHLYLADQWCALTEDAFALIVTDDERLALAGKIAAGMRRTSRVIVWDAQGRFLSDMKELRPRDLVIALFSFDSFVARGANRYFSPLAKPEGVAAKYAFIRLGISEASLAQGLSTPKERIYQKIDEMRAYPRGSVLRVTSAAGTDITLAVEGFTTCRHEIRADGEMAFLPPSEVTAEVLPGTANGVVAVDVTVGQLYHYGNLLGEFGLVDRPVMLLVENGRVADATGGAMAEELKSKLFALPPECREVVELGHGLSAMRPTGLIGVDESIIDTCHFGIGDGARCGVHLDVVIHKPAIVRA